MKKYLIGMSLCLTMTGFSSGQQKDSVSTAQPESVVEKGETAEMFKLSGYIQTEFQHGGKAASLKVGGKNTNSDKSFNRFGVRRGRLKFQFKKNLFNAVFQIDITEKGFGVKDAYLSVSDPWAGSSSVRAGVFNRPFGHEVSYSSSRRESPERARVITTIFPEERDLGVMVSLQAPETSSWSLLKLDAGLIAGNGIEKDTDNRKDFLSHLSAHKELGDLFEIEAGISYYNGGVYQGSENVYRMTSGSFEADTSPENLGGFSKREYMGADFRLSAKTALGTSRLLAEYVFGTQPGTAESSKSPNYSQLPEADTYIRDFSGGYFGFVHEFGNLPLSMVLKYDFYDPNTQISKDRIGLNGSGKADIGYSTLGAGLLWQLTDELRMTAYYDWVRNEKSKNLSGYEKDIEDNVFTLRLQYKF